MIFNQILQLDRDGEPYTVKQIKIADLPECYYKTRLLEMVVDPTAMVWVAGQPGHELVGDWTAYIGHPPFTAWKPEHRDAMMPYALRGLQFPEAVCNEGDKLDKYTAEQLFPEFTELKYRS